MKNPKLNNAADILKKSYGDPGSNKREQFRDEAYGYYLSEILKNRRIELGFTQDQLADLVGKKRPYISRVENGEDIRISNFMLIAHALKLRVDVLPVQDSF